LVESDNLSLREAYLAMFRFLERYYELTRADDVGALLGSLALLPDGGPADAAMWSDWVKAVADVKAGVVDPNLVLTPEQKP
jgi:hypothetical protein